MKKKGLEVTRKLEKSKHITLVGYAEFVYGGLQVFKYRNAEWGLAPLTLYTQALTLYKIHKIGVEEISATAIKQYSLDGSFTITKLKQDMDLYLERKGDY